MLLKRLTKSNQSSAKTRRKITPEKRAFGTSKSFNQSSKAKAQRESPHQRMQKRARERGHKHHPDDATKKPLKRTSWRPKTGQNIGNLY